MTLSVASYSVESFEDQVSDVVGVLTLIPSESHVWNCFTFVLEVAFIAGQPFTIEKLGLRSQSKQAEVGYIIFILRGLVSRETRLRTEWVQDTC